MTNAKSRLVRIIALALAVLMIVPMALVGCKQEQTGVDQAALDAALAEALQAAQAAQDAANKAAQDAKDAQDKLAEAEKNAADLQGQIDAMKNTTTTAAPATTTQAPVVAEDAKVVDAYIANMLFNDESEYSKIVAKYEALVGIYSEADQIALGLTIDTAEIAIQRAPSVDYVNQLVAALAADLDAIPTFSERVKEAYDAIDFAADTDVIDVVKAAKILELALAVNVGDLEDDELNAIVAAEKKALNEFGADKLDLVALIANEFYRYTGEKMDATFDIAVEDDEILFADVYALVQDKKIADAIAAIFGAEEGEELKVSAIVYGGYEKDVVKTIEKLYTAVYNEYKKDYADLKEDFEIAFVGEAYILSAEGNYLREKLAEAAERIGELDAAAAEYAKSAFGAKLAKIVDDYAEAGLNYLYTNKFTKYGVDYVDGLLTEWMAKYNFTKDDANLQAIIGDDYAGFAAAKAYVNYINDWAVKAAALDVNAIAEALAEFEDEDTYSYSEYGTVIKNLAAFLSGTKAKNYEDGLLNALYNEEAIYDDEVTANVNEIVEEVFGKKVTLAALEAVCEYLEGDLADFVAAAKKINEDIAKLDLEKIDFTYLTKITGLKTRIDTLFTEMGVEAEEVDDNDNVLAWDLNDINADLVNYDGIVALEAAYDEIREALIGEAISIVENYIAWMGTATEDETIVYGEYEIEAEPFVINIYSVNDILAMKAIYDTLLDAIASGVAADVTLDLVTVDDILEDEFTVEDVVKYYREMYVKFYEHIMEGSQSVIYSKLSQSVYMNGNTAGTANSQWLNTAATEAASSAKLTEYAEKYGINYNYVKSGNAAKKKTDGSYIDVYNTASGYGKGTYLAAVESVDPDKFATYKGEDLNRRLDSFDHKAYYTAVKAAVDAAYTTWYVGSDSDSTAFLNNENNLSYTAKFISDIIHYVLAFDLWNIADEFEIEDEVYSFEILPYDWKNGKISGASIYSWIPTLVVYDEDGEVVANNKIVLEDAEYTISVEIGDDAVIDANTGKFTELPDVVIYATDAEGAKVTLGELVEDEGAYVYTFADSKEEVLANVAKVGTVAYADHATNKYGKISAANYEKILEAYESQKFYKIHATVWAKINGYSSNSAVKQLATEYGVKYKKVSMASMTADELYKALAKFIGEANAILAQAQ